jgi:hypothetical protein
MRRNGMRAALAGLLLALLLAACGAAISQPLADGATAPAASATAMADYRRKLAEYTLARQQYEAETEAYWSAIAAKRRDRNAKRRNQIPIALDDYVLAQPPRYTGPPRPIDPSAPAETPPAPPRKYVPVVADFLASAKQYFNFVPARPRSELQFKRAYARAAAQAGLTREQVVRLYAFESGGNGKYDVQAGLEYSRNRRAISTALGYNQLLHVNSLSLLAEKGDHFIKALTAKAAGRPGAARSALERKIAVVRRMVAFARTVPVRWSEHEKLADTPQGLGLHALNLDIDVGPLLQSQKLLDSILFARRKGFDRPLSAAELEMMNFTGDGNGFDIVTMPTAMRGQVPTANFFRQSGYERNPVVIRNNTVAKLLAATDAVMDREIKRQGAKDMAAAYSR